MSEPATPSVLRYAQSTSPSLRLVEAREAVGNCLHQCAALGEVDRRYLAARRRGRGTTHEQTCPRPIADCPLPIARRKPATFHTARPNVTQRQNP